MMYEERPPGCPVVPRCGYDPKTGIWYYSLLDIITIVTRSAHPRRYWSDLRRKLTKEGSHVYEKVIMRKLPAPDGKYYNTSVADAETILRILQAMGGEAGEPIKMWLANLGMQRLRELRNNPDAATPHDKRSIELFIETQVPQNKGR